MFDLFAVGSSESSCPVRHDTSTLRGADLGAEIGTFSARRVAKDTFCGQSVASNKRQY